MAVIKTIRNPVDTNSLFEDPIPGSNYLYFQNDAYSKDTLAPLYDIGMVYTTNGSVINNTFGFSGVGQTGGTYDRRIGGILQLNGETTHVRHNLFNTVNDVRNTLDISPFVSMDTTYKVKPVQYFTDGNNNLVISSFNYTDLTVSAALQYAGSYVHFWTKLNTNAKDLATSGYVTSKQNASTTQATQPATSFAYWAMVNANYGTNAWPVYRNPATNNLVWIAQAYYGTTYGCAAVIGASQINAFNATPNSQAPSSGVNLDFSGQMVGVSKLDFNTIQIHHSVTSDGVNNIYKYQDGSNSYSTLNTFTTPPYPAGSGGTGTYNLSTSTNMAALNFSTATWWFAFTATNYVSTFSGTATVSGSILTVSGVTTGTISAGMTITQIVYPAAAGGVGGSLAAGAAYTGTVITSFGQGTNQGGDRATNFGQRIPKFASKTFTDATTATTLGFYIPYVDAKGGFHPLYYRWNQSTDVFTRVTDITMIYPGTSLGSVWSYDTYSASSLSLIYGMQRAWYTETFVSSSTRYLIFMQLHGAGGVYDANPTMRTFPTYSIDTSTYKTLTYTGKIEVPATPKNIVWLNDDKTILGIFCHANFYVYTFSASSGWTQTGNFPYQFNAVGRDNTGRIWAQDTGPGWGRLHLLTLNVPVSIVVTSDATSYNFAGTAVSANLTVNAYSYSGTRIATSVKLVIDGGSMTFAGSNLTKTVTTSASGDTIVPITITGGGVSNIIASAVVT